MMSRFYSGVAGWRHRLLAIALPLLANIGAGCGSSAAVVNEPEPAASVQSLLDQAHDAERARKYHAARGLYLRAIAEAPDDSSAAIANREMASALIFWGEYEGAKQRLLESLKLDNKQARVWHDLGMVQEHQGNRDVALLSLHRAVSLAPKEPRSRVSYAALLVKQSRFADAIVQYEALLVLPISSRIEVATHKALRILRAEVERGK